ncbi:hypothetical protein GOODEAATRI_017684 [Goodea atripinnis]|uniref:Uncharacterized protein n=1 Tax=Goodea atripinnis TaxID=208336 RepID=A0ABV0PEW4_9TELE
MAYSDCCDPKMPLYSSCSPAVSFVDVFLNHPSHCTWLHDKLMSLSSLVAHTVDLGTLRCLAIFYTHLLYLKAIFACLSYSEECLDKLALCSMHLIRISERLKVLCRA